MEPQAEHDKYQSSIVPEVLRELSLGRLDREL